MKNFIEKIDMAVGYVSRIGAIVGVAAILAMMVMITINVVVRKTMGWAFLFVEEYSGYALVLIVYFGLAYALRTDKHIYMELLIRKFPQRVRDGVGLMTTLVCLGTLVYLLLKGIQFSRFSFRFGIRSEWYSGSIMWPFHLLVPIGLGMFIAEMIRYLIRLVAKILSEEKMLHSTSSSGE